MSTDFIKMPTDGEHMLYSKTKEFNDQKLVEILKVYEGETPLYTIQYYEPGRDINTISDYLLPLEYMDPSYRHTKPPCSLFNNKDLVYYIKNEEEHIAKILKIDYDDGVPFYSLKLFKPSNITKTTTFKHLIELRSYSL